MVEFGFLQGCGGGVLRRASEHPCRVHSSTFIQRPAPTFEHHREVVSGPVQNRGPGSPCRPPQATFPDASPGGSRASGRGWEFPLAICLGGSECYPWGMGRDAPGRAEKLGGSSGWRVTSHLPQTWRLLANVRSASPVQVQTLNTATCRRHWEASP